MPQPRVLLVRPPAIYRTGSVPPGITIPTGILYIAAVLENSGARVAVFDAQLSTEQPVTDLGDGHVRMGYSWDEVRDRIKLFDSDLVGITSSFSSQYEQAMVTARLVKDVKPECHVVVGGNHPTARPDDFLFQGGPVDYVCLGEGEQTMLDLVDAYARSRDIRDVNGVAYLDSNGTVARTNSRGFITNLDQIPLPAYHLVDLENYFSLAAKGFKGRLSYDYPGSERSIPVITSRGCPFDCIFCSIHLHMGRRWRCHSVRYVKEHLELLVSRYGVRHIHFEDDNISANRARFSGILAALNELSAKVTWDTPNGIRVDTLTKEIVQQCYDSGCTYLTFGVESGNQRVLTSIINKKLHLDDVNDAARWCREIGLDAMAFFVIGFPGEKPTEMNETVEYALHLQREYKVQPHLFLATPLPGTMLEKICLERGILDRPLAPEQYATMTQGAHVLDGDTFTVADLRDILASYARASLRQYIFGALVFTLRHPLVLIAVFRKIRERKGNVSPVQALFRAFQFRNSLLRILERY